MTTSEHAPAGSRERVRGPAELVQAIPYLLGFHPQRSLVLVGLDAGLLVVTARLDLCGVDTNGLLADTVASLARGGSTELVGLVFDDDVAGAAGDPLAAMPHGPVVAALDDAAERAQCSVLDTLLVARGRWWSYGCPTSTCCPPQGRPVPREVSTFVAGATYSGVVPLPDREALAATLEPLDDTTRAALAPALTEAESTAVAAVLDDRLERHRRSVKRAIFAAARAGDAPPWTAPADPDVARYGVALLELAVRDAVWMAIDDKRLDGRALWRELARRLPPPYDAPALFLFGWASWRAGDGALAGIAALRAVESDPAYSAADLLLAALSKGVDPRRLPRLRLPRSA